MNADFADFSCISVDFCVKFVLYCIEVCREAFSF